MEEKFAAKGIVKPGRPGTYRDGRPGPTVGTPSVCPPRKPLAKCAAKRRALFQRAPLMANTAASSISESRRKWRCGLD